MLLGLGPFRKRDPEPETPPPPPAPVIVPVPTYAEPLFGGSLPLDPGPVPEGLANDSAQGCYGCHAPSHQGWIAGPHAAPPSDGFLDAVSRTGLSGCTTCHLPLLAQHDQLPTWGPEDVATDNPDWRATLTVEGVTCAACHIRDGEILVSTEEAARGADTPAPHSRVFAPELSSSEACGACHQLTWPGANLPLYDTYGEWQRSAWAEAGVGCVDCHRGPDDGHTARADLARAVSVLFDPDRRRVERGGAPLTVDVQLQNTGAGHAIPTGTPFRGLRLMAELVRPAASPDDEPISFDQRYSVDLARTLADVPPWYTIEDTRLAAGESRSWTWVFDLDASVPAGRWDLRITLAPIAQGEVGEPLLVRQLPLNVE